MKVSLELIKAIEDYKNGDQIAFNVIYNESHKYIYVCVNNVVSGNDNKEEMICDIMQDTYVEISKHIDSLQNANLFLSWAGTIATRKCYEYIKKSGKYVLLNEDESFDTLADDDNIIPEEIMQNKEKQNLLRDIIQNELTEMQKLCIVGYFYNEMKQSEIAEELGIPENSVKSHLLRAKAKIKDAVVDLEKNKGTKLYSVSPFLLLLFADEVQACVVSSTIGQTVLTGIGLGGAQVAATGVGAAGASTASATGATTVTATTVEAGVAGTSMGTTATTVASTAAKGALAAFKVKAIAIASAAVLTVAGVGAGVGIAIHNKNEAKETEVTTEETTKEIVTEETTIDDNHEIVPPISQIGQKYLMDVWDSDDEDNLFLIENAISAGIESIQITEEEIIINLFEVDNVCYCQLLDKKTGKKYSESIGGNSAPTVFKKDFNINDYYLYVSYSEWSEANNIRKWEGWDTSDGLFFEITESLSSPTSIWDEIEFSKCGEMCSNRLYTKIDINESESEILEYNISCMVESIAVHPENIVIELADIRNIEANSYIDFNGLAGKVRYQLINKVTEESIFEKVQSFEETTITIDRVAEGLTDVSDCVLAITYDHNFPWNESGVWLFYEMPVELPYDAMKETLIDAAEKLLANYESTPICIAFTDYDGDRIPEFIVCDSHMYSFLLGKMYKYENNEYVYCRDVDGFENGFARVYKDKTDGSYAVLEMQTTYEPVDISETDYMFVGINKIYLVDMDKNEEQLIKTIESDDNMLTEHRIFYNGENISLEELVDILEMEIPQQYEYIGDIKFDLWSAECEEFNSLVESYNGYLLNIYPLYN